MSARPRNLAIACVALASSGAAADSLSVRVSAGAGALKESTWTVPCVALVARHAVHDAFVQGELGYSPIDNSTYLADGQVIRLGFAAGLERARVRAAGVIDIESIGFHADPDVLVDHPEVDIAPRRGGFVPTLGAETALRITDTVSAGAFARVALTRLELFDSPSGDRGTARLVLAGVFLELRLH